MRCYLTSILIVLTFPAFSQITLKRKNESCLGKKDGEIEVIVAGTDNHMLEYKWKKNDKHFAGGYKITGLEPGTYSVTVSTKSTSSAQCMGFSSAVIFPGRDVSLELGARLLAIDPDPLGCGERPVFTYKLYALPHGGNPPYYFSWGAGGLGDVSGGGGENENTLIVSGSFINQTCTVIDSVGCVDSEGFKKTGAIKICPRDPNDITGPEGYDDSLRWVSVNQTMNYAVRFENDPIFATANAAVVFVTVPIDDDIDPFSFRLGVMGFGSKIIELPSNSSFYQQRLDYSQDLGFMLDVTAGLDIPNNRFFWLMETIDPLTGQPPTDPTAGFLPVNDTLTGSGEGFILFTCKPKASTLTGEVVDHQASIVFDINEPLLTNTWSNTIDAFAPISTVTPFPDTLYTNVVPFEFSIEDDQGGCGVQFGDILLSTNNVVFYPNGLWMEEDSTALTLNWGTKYYYKIVGTDFVDNREEPMADSFYIIPQRSVDFLTPDKDHYCLWDTLEITADLVSISSADLYISIDSGITYMSLANNVTTWPYDLVLDSSHLYPFVFLKVRNDESNVEDISIPFSVYGLPELTTPVPDEGCFGDIFFVESSGVNNYLWSPDSIIGNPIGRFSNAYPKMSQYAWVRGTDVFGCSSLDSVWLNVYPTSLDTLPQPLCEGDSIFINGQWETAEGFYPTTYVNVNGCDSVIVSEVYFESPCIWGGGLNVYVDQDATGANNGTSWTDAFTDLNDAIYVAGRYVNVQEIWVAEGIYHPHPTLRDTSFVLKDSIKIYGGFLGIETMREERSTDPELVFLSGDINLPDTLWDNSFHNVVFSPSCVDCVLDGLTIQYGYADQVGDDTGAGILNFGTGHIYNVVFERNYATELGAAVYSSGMGANLVFEGCTFRLNTSSLGRDVVNVGGAQIQFAGVNSLY
jgi:hypothetical protein